MLGPNIMLVIVKQHGIWPLSQGYENQDDPHNGLRSKSGKCDGNWARVRPVLRLCDLPLSVTL